MVLEPVDFKGHLPIHAPSPKSAAGRDGRFTHQNTKSDGRDRVVLEKINVPHRIDKTLDKSLYRGDNPLLMNQTHVPYQIDKTLDKKPVDFKGHLPIHAPSPKSVAGRDGRFTHQSPKSDGLDGVVSGKIHVPHRIDKTLDKSLYRGDNPHLMN
ncbi:hypothetical protein MTR_3g090040 [Medicago truncatula]|uniref:Uncharacterized protein n=1 Tax=Medicago truncatula TaxID=3880 RepID=G7J5N7_MEDTR|nr:hypothetical protein MTR_3g090040 [Medicago truncatula]